MSCVNTNSQEYKSLTKGMNPREKFVARAVMSRFMTNNDGRMPDFIELKSAISDLYNSNKGGIDYQGFYNEVKAIFKQLLPGLSEAEIDQRVKFVDKLELMRLRNGKEVLTSFIDNVVYVSKTLPAERGDRAYNDVRHEIFHILFNNFLSEQEQSKIMETFKRWKPEYSSIMDKEELEERMADAFEDYRVSPKKTIPIMIRDFFVDLLKFLGIIGDNYVDIKKLFDDVENGKFTRNYLKDSLVTRDKTILSKYTEFSTDLDLFLQAKSFVLNNLNELMNPEDNKQLTEVNNTNLFLNQNYQSPLFQNNKDIFKLGLTKNDALKQLQRRIRALRDSRTVDPQLARVIDVLSKTHILKDLFDYLQPFSTAEVTSEGELVLKGHVEEDPTEALLESDEEINSLEIGSKDLINPITKISEVVKDFLSNITYETTPGNFINIDPGAGFISLLNLLGSMYGNTSVEDNLASLKSAYAETVKGNQTKAVYNKLRELHESLQASDRIVLNIKGVSDTELAQLGASLDNNDIRHETFKDTMTIVIPPNLKIENEGTNNVDNRVVFTFNRFKEGRQSFRIVQRKAESGRAAESNKTFIERIANDTGIPSFVVAKLFKYNEQRNQLAELTKVASSLRKLSPKFVKVQTTRQSIDGYTTQVTSYAFINKVNEYKTSGSLASIIRDRFDIQELRSDIVGLVDRYRSLRERGSRTDLRNLLQDLLVDKFNAISISDFQRISDKDVTNLLNSLDRVVNFTPDLRTEKNSEEFDNSDQYLRHTSNFANLLTKYTFEKNNPTSFSVSTSNKQKWENVMKNTSFMIFDNLRNFANGVIRANKLLPYLRNSFNNYLRFNPLFDHNFNTGEVLINQNLLKTQDEDFYADHQETYFENRNSNYDRPPVPFSKESPRDWINRNFLAMFQLPILESQTASRRTERVGLSYFQQKFQPESAPNVSVIKMGIHTTDSIYDGIAHMILQEAYMVHKASTSGRKKLISNTKKSYLPGLEGSTYFIQNGNNVFFDEAGNLNPEFGTIINGKLNIIKTNRTMHQLIETILENLDGSMEEFVNLALTEKATIDGNNIADMYDRIRNSYLQRYQLSDAEKTTLRGIFVDAKTDLSKVYSNPNFEEQKAALKKAFSSYYLNSFVNGFFMNQLSSGATQNYKNPLDEVKRQAGVNAMNDTGLIDNKHGMKNNYKNVVIAAANNFYGRSHRFANIPLLQRFFRNKEQEVGDAQSWDIPEYKKMLRKSFGKSVDIGVITKDVHFEINNDGYVDYRKTSSAELTNELVKNNKTLRDLRYALTFKTYLNSLSEEERPAVQARIDYLYNRMIDNGNKANNFDGLVDNLDEFMEYQDIIQEIQDKDMMIHKASFESAIKGSKPGRMSQFIKNNETGTFDFELEPSSVLNLNSAYNGIQQAIRHRYIDAFISHFTQLTYLIGLNRTETSIKNNRIITRTLSRFTKSGIYDSLFDYRMGYDQGVLKANPRSRKEFIKDLVKKLDLPGNERIVSLLNTPKISMNNPLFSEKLMQTFFNSLSKRTVSPKHPGGSFVLQSEFGFEAARILSENQGTMKIPELVTDDRGNLLYAECYLPEMYSDQIKAGEMIYYDSEQYNKMFGFRIPSSDLHSSVPLKVIGYYPSSMQDNVIVIPSAVTALHGSDFDVDKLFVVRYGVFGQEDEDIDPKAVPTEGEETVRREYRTRFQSNNQVVAQKGIKYGYTAPEAEYNQAGALTSFGPNDRHNPIIGLDGILINEKVSTQERIIALEEEKTAVSKRVTTSKLQDRQKSNDWRRIDNEIKSLEKHLKTLRTIQNGLYSNTILDAVLDNISYSGENASDILFGITFDPVKGYEETSEYSQLARVFSDINRAQGKDDVLAERPTLFRNLDEAREQNLDLYEDVKETLEDNLGVDTTTDEGREDWLALINQSLQNDWVEDRDEFIRRQRGSGSVNINKVEQHVNIHKETYMAAGLVGLIANFSKGLAYAFHGITNDSNHIELDIPDNQVVEVDGIRVDKLTLENRDRIKNQELRSLALNAAIDHVKEQILNVINVGNNTAKIFLAAISTELTLHQASMIMLQPVAKELNSSNATTVAATLRKMQQDILDTLKETGRELNQTEVDELRVTTRDLERHIQTDFSTILADRGNGFRRNLILQYKMTQQLSTLNQIGNEISEISQVLSVIQGLPYSLENAYDKVKTLDKFINVENFFRKLQYQERSEYTQNGFKDDLKSNKNILSNVNLANNENVLAALEGIKTQIDVASEMFTENSVQAQFLINNMIKAISNNSDPATMFTGEYDQNLGFNTVRDFPIQEKYLKGKNTFNMFKMISRNIFNYLTSGLNISYNNDSHLFSLSISNQKLLTVRKEEQAFTLGTVRSYVSAFLMKEGDAYNTDRTYNGDDYVVSQINPEWRLKPLAVIKRQNSENKFLKGLGVDTNFRDKVRIMTFNSASVNTAENLAEVEQAVHALNNLRNIYVMKNKKGQWVDVPSSQHPETPEMNEITFNIIKASLYIDKFKFGMSKATNVIPPIYYQKVFQSLDTLLRDMIYYNESTQGNKYYKDFKDLDNQGNTRSALDDIKENLFINTVFSIPTVLPNLSSVLPNKRERFQHVNKQAGILYNGNIYDMYLDANILDKAQQVEDQEKENTVKDSEIPSQEGSNQEVDQDLAETQAESDLFEKFRKNPSFLTDESPRKRGTFEIFMKVGTTGSKESNDLRYYYKKVGTVSGKLTNNSFDLNLLLNHYQIRDYFDPKRLAIPVKEVDFSTDRISLQNVTISSFLMNVYDDRRTEQQNREQVERAIDQQIDYLRTLPENANKSVQTLRNEIRTKLNVENVINTVNEVSLYDSRNMDRVGIKHFKVLSRTISPDRRSVSFELQALPQDQQIRFSKFDAPLEVLKTIRKGAMTRQEKINYINSIPGAKTITSAQADQMTDAQIDVEFDRASEVDETKEIDQVLKDKSC